MSSSDSSKVQMLLLNAKEACYDTENIVKSIKRDCGKMQRKMDKVKEVSSFFQEVDRSNERSFKMIYDYKQDWVESENNYADVGLDSG